MRQNKEILVARLEYEFTNVTSDVSAQLAGVFGKNCLFSVTVLNYCQIRNEHSFWIAISLKVKIQKFCVSVFL